MKNSRNDIAKYIAKRAFLDKEEGPLVKTDNVRG